MQRNEIGTTVRPTLSVRVASNAIASTRPAYSRCEPRHKLPFSDLHVSLKIIIDKPHGQEVKFAYLTENDYH